MASAASQEQSLGNNGVDGANTVINGNMKQERDNYKAKITGLPSCYCLEDFKKWLNDELHVTYLHLTVLQSSANIALLSCVDDSSLETAINKIDKSEWRGNQLSCFKISPADLKRKPHDKVGDETGFKRARIQFSPREKVFRFNCAIQHLPYKEQLVQLHEEARLGTYQLGEMLVGYNPELLGWWYNQLQKHKGNALLLQKVVGSPAVDGYRNKYDFKVGQDPDSREPVVGLKIDNQSDFAISVKQGDEFKQFPDVLKRVVEVFDGYIKASSLLPYSSSPGGHWRNFVVRVGSNNEVIVMVVLHPRDLPDETLEKIKTDLINFFVSGEGKDCGVVSLYLKLYSLYIDKNCPQSEKPPVLLWGKTHIEETMEDLGLTFIISPTSFFQVNKGAGEKLYTAVAELAHVDEETSVIDLCCASGGIALTLAKKAKEVYGIDVLEASIHDARVNAERNGITNCEFVHGRAEDTLSGVIKKLTGKKVVVICDPPRDGLGQPCITELRKCQKISKIIYLVSSQRVLHKNFMDLSLPHFTSKHPGKPFVPVRAIPVDLSPHTLHCCLVLLLERIDPFKYEALPVGPSGPIPLHSIPPMMGPPLGPPLGPRPLLGPCGPGGAGPRVSRPLGPMGPPPILPCAPMGAPRPGPRGPFGAPRGLVPRSLSRPGPQGSGSVGPRPLGIRPLVQNLGRVGPRPPQHLKDLVMTSFGRPRSNGSDSFYQDDPLDGPSFFGPESDVQPPLPAQGDSFWWQ